MDIRTKTVILKFLQCALALSLLSGMIVLSQGHYDEDSYQQQLNAGL